MQIYGKMNINEGVFSDILKRDNGEEVRKEDELGENNRHALDKYIEMFANRVANGDEYYNSLDELCCFINDNKNSMHIEKFNPDIDKILAYVKDFWADELCDVVNDKIEEYDNDAADLDEGVFSDILKRENGEEQRMEDKLTGGNRVALDKYIRRCNISTFDGYGKFGDDKLNCFKHYILKYRDLFQYMEEVGQYDIPTILDYVENNWDKGENISKKLEDDYAKKSLKECDAVAPNGGLVLGDVQGMGPITFPGECGEKGSGDLPMPSGKVYQQVAPFGTFIQMKKSKKKKKKFRKEDEPCAHSDNPPMYNYVDDYRDYVDRTYNKMK